MKRQNTKTGCNKKKKFIALTAYIKKEERSQINLTLERTN